MRRLFIFSIFAIFAFIEISSQSTKILSFYKDGFVVNRIPLNSIDSMNFNDTNYLLDVDELLSFTNDIMKLIVKHDFTSTSHDSFGYMAILHAGDMMSEDIVMSKLSHFRYDYTHDNNAYNYRRTNMIWLYFTEIIKLANKVIDSTPQTVKAESLKKVLGHAYGMRSFAYFHLVQLYQFTGYQDNPVNLQLPTIPILYSRKEPLYNKRNYRVPALEVLAHCESDYIKSKELLTGLERESKNELNVNVINGLLARLYLLKGDWNNAITSARAAKDGFPLMSSLEIMDGFMSIDNPEWIWGFEHNTETSTMYASFFSHISNLSSGYAGLQYAPRLIDKRLYDLIPADDLRKKWFQNPEASINVTQNVDVSATAWKLPFANIKFGSDPNFTQDYMYMRSAEMYLIEAEAQYRAGNSDKALEIINQLLKNRYLDNSAKSINLEDILLQRRIELWGEGFAYFDLKRLNKGIDRTYIGTNHEVTARIAVSADNSKWNFEFPQIAYLNFPEMISTEQMPILTPQQPYSISGTKAQYQCVMSNFDSTLKYNIGIHITTDPNFISDIRTVTTTKLNTNPIISFTDTISGLKPETTYYLKYYYNSKYGVVQSKVFNISTPKLKIPTVDHSVSNIYSTSVNLAASYQFIDNNTTTVISKGFEISSDSSFLTGITQYLVNDIFTFNISNLTPSTKYFVRAFVKTIDGYAYSKITNFETLVAAPLMKYVGKYYMKDYRFDNEQLSSTCLVDLFEVPGNVNQMKMKNFWGGNEEIIIDFDLNTNQVSIENNQIIFRHNTFGNTIALPFDGFYTKNTPLLGSINNDGSITLAGWSAQTATNSLGQFKYSTITPVLNHLEGIYTEVDYLYSTGNVDNTHPDAVTISKVSNNNIQLAIHNLWSGDHTIIANIDFENNTFSIAPQIIYSHSTYGECYIYPYINGAVNKTGIAVTGIIEDDGSLTINPWAASVTAGSFGIYSKTTLKKSSSSSSSIKTFVAPIMKRAIKANNLLIERSLDQN